MQWKSLLLATALLFGCTAVQQQASRPPAPDDLHFHNLQLFPQNITRDELLTSMRRFTQALGVKCGHCHVPNPPGSDPKFDFPNDAKPEKNAARTMIRMTRTINQNYVSRVPEAHTVVTCWTCHRGHTQPDIPPSLPPED